MTRNNNTGLMSCNWNECDLKPHTSINWRASLVPAAAVIPAPIAYIKIVAVKKLVVEHVPAHGVPLSECVTFSGQHFFWEVRLHLTVQISCQIFYFEKNRVFQASMCFAYRSME